jgi:hypothetical protein
VCAIDFIFFTITDIADYAAAIMPFRFSLRLISHIATDFLLHAYILRALAADIFAFMISPFFIACFIFAISYAITFIDAISFRFHFAIFATYYAAFHDAAFATALFH